MTLMTVDSTPCYLLICIVLLTGAAAPLAAQETGEDQENQAYERMFFDSVDVDVVNIEVVVTDKHGQPVTDLARDDFEVFEDGRKAELTNFHVVSGTSEEGTSGEGTSEEGTSEESPEHDTAPASEEMLPDDLRGHRLVILIDNMNISPQSRKLLFTKLREHLRQRTDPAAQHQQIMLAALGRKVEIILPFTGDHQRVLAALDEVERQGSSYALLDGDRRMFINRLQRASLRRF